VSSTGGALTQDGRAGSPRLPAFSSVRALAKVFRGKYLTPLQRAFTTGQLVFRRLAHLAR